MTEDKRGAAEARPDVRSLVERCLEDAGRFTREIIEKTCEAEPDAAAEIRRQYEALRASGLLGMPVVDERRPDPWDSDARAALAETASSDVFPPVGPYRPLKEIGRGGQAVVYLAEDMRFRRPVALKLLKASQPLSASMLNRFRREAQVASKLDHPGICGVYDAGVHDNTSFIAMRYVRGETLADKIAVAREKRAARGRDGSVTLGSTTRGRHDGLLETFEKVARALHVAHEAGIVHRDVKPGNIMVTPAGEPVLLDFGLAGDEDGGLMTLTQSGDHVGTPAYMSPEQLAAKRIRLDRRTDVYSLGVSLFEALTLERPFRAKTRDAMYQAIQYEEARDLRKMNPALGRDLAVVVAAALEKDRDRRYQTAEDFAEDLRRIRTHEPIAARPVSAFGRAARWAKRRPARAALVAALLVGVPIVAGLLGYIAANRSAIAAAEERARRGRVEARLEEAFETLSRFGARDSVPMFEAVLAVDPGCEEAVGGKALALYRLGDYRPCLDYLRQHREMEAALPALTRIRADTLRKLGRKSEAGDLERGLAEPRTALGCFLESRRLISWSVRAFYREDPAPIRRRALEYARQAVLAAPRARLLYHATLADTVSRQRGDDVARLRDETLRTLLALWPRSRRAWGWAGVLHTDAAKKMAAFEQATALDPDYAWAYVQLGVLHKRAERFDEAIAALKEALARAPHYAWAHYQLGCVFRLVGRADDGIAALRRAIELDPEKPVYYCRLINCLCMKSSSHETRKALDVGIGVAKKAIAIQHDYIPAHDLLAKLYLDKGRYREALEAYRAVSRLCDVYRAPGLEKRARNMMKRCERLLVSLAKLDRVLAGDAELGDADEAHEVAVVAYKEARFADAARVSQRAHDRFFDTISLVARYNMACCCALGAAGVGTDGARVTTDERERWRRLARRFMESILADCERAKRDGVGGARLGKWQADADLASVRDAAALAALPAPERAAWQAFWSRVAALIRRLK